MVQDMGNWLWRCQDLKSISICIVKWLSECFNNPGDFAVFWTEERVYEKAIRLSKPDRLFNVSAFVDLSFYNFHNTKALLFQHILTGTVKVHTVYSVAFFPGDPFLHLAVVAVGWIWWIVGAGVVVDAADLSCKEAGSDIFRQFWGVAAVVNSFCSIT